MSAVLFYGGLSSSEYLRFKNTIHHLVSSLLDAGIDIATREGQNKPTVELMADGDSIWIDNIVLDAEQEYRTQGGTGSGKAISFIFDDSPRSMHQRDFKYLQSHNRINIYREMLSMVDATITVGGKEGVFRIGLIAATLGKTVIPLAFTGGSSRTLWNELHQSELLPEEISNIIGPQNIPPDSSLSKLIIKNISERPQKTNKIIDPEKLTILEILKALTPKQAIGILGVIATLVFAVYKCGEFIGTFKTERDQAEKSRSPSPESKIPPVQNQTKNDDKKPSKPT